jgi:hypothetical protein
MVEDLSGLRRSCVVPEERDLNPKVIATLVSLCTLIGAAFAVDNLYVRRAHAEEAQKLQAAQVFKLQRALSIQQERDKIDSELQVIRLELEFLTVQYQDVTLNDGAKEKLRDRKQYLRKREEILEQRQLALRDVNVEAER